jgi:hypothetical protein
MKNNKQQTSVEKLLALKDQLKNNPWQYDWIIEIIEEVEDILNEQE